MATASEGMGVLSTIQDGNLLMPRCELTVEGAVVESRGDRDTILRTHDVKPEYA